MVYHYHYDVHITCNIDASLSRSHTEILFCLTPLKTNAIRCLTLLRLPSIEHFCIISLDILSLSIPIDDDDDDDADDVVLFDDRTDDDAADNESSQAS
mmetsp:Transcript_51143/g.123471  ORF Transcript_51143/g.123471 Transcript_51143/m.123471 type:complete len:98 (-) Transcript_51143:1642-1935(-)